jgi:hypothetical protein
MTEPETPPAPSLVTNILTDSRIHFDWRLISNMQDAIAYFGFRTGFRRGSNSGART